MVLHAIVNMLRPGTSKTFQDYVTDVFVPYITYLLQHLKRLDIIWDVYLAESLKVDTRSKRGKGVRMHVDVIQCLILEGRACFFCSRAISGPDTIQRRRAAGLSIMPTAPPSPFTEALFCSCAWSIAIAENVCYDFFTTKFPFTNLA